jgi:hypothetical protein
MRAVAGAIVVLAGAVVSGAGMVGDAVLTAANRSGYGPGVVFMASGTFIGLVGIGLLVNALKDERRP